MVAYLGSVWGCRYFWLSLVWMDLRARYRGSVLGLGWSLLHPIALTAILCTVFSAVFHMRLPEYAPFLMAGLTCWQFLVNVSLLGSQCFFQGEAYIRQHPAPLAIYPLRTMLANGFHFLLGFALVILLAAGLRGFDRLWPLLTLLPTAVLLGLFGWSLATLFGLITVRFRDAHYLTELGFQGLFYLTPVMYKPDMLTGRGLGVLMRVNPVVPFLTLLRQPILDSQAPALSTYAAALGIALTAAGAAGLLLRLEERRLIFHL
jgi:ABC-type polysaccharide/polyol phosphate export permease